MTIFHAFNINASALTAQRLRMDVASANIANTYTTRGRISENGEFEPYRRKMVAMQSGGRSFKHFLQKAELRQRRITEGVHVSTIIHDQSPFRLVYDPIHPDANED